MGWAQTETAEENEGGKSERMLLHFVRRKYKTKYEYDKEDLGTIPVIRTVEYIVGGGAAKRGLHGANTKSPFQNCILNNLNLYYLGIHI